MGRTSVNFFLVTVVNPAAFFNITGFSFQCKKGQICDFIKEKKKFYCKFFPASSAMCFLYLTNHSFFLWPGGNPEHDITSFRNHVILLVNVKSHCSAWEVPTSGPRQTGWLKQVQETVFKDNWTRGVITLLISQEILSISAHRLLADPCKVFPASLSLHQSLPPSPPLYPHLCASSRSLCFSV